MINQHRSHLLCQFTREIYAFNNNNNNNSTTVLVQLLTPNDKCTYIVKLRGTRNVFFFVVNSFSLEYTSARTHAHTHFFACVLCKCMFVCVCAYFDNLVIESTKSHQSHNYNSPTEFIILISS